MALIRKAQEENRNDRIFQQWVVQLPTMSYTGQPISFDEYRARVTGANIDRRSAAEILADANAAEAELLKGGDKNGT